MALTWWERNSADVYTTIAVALASGFLGLVFTLAGAGWRPW